MTETSTVRPPDVATSAARNPLRWFVLAVVLAGNILDLMDATIVNVAGPSIRHDLGGSASTLLWLSAGYTLAFAVLHLLKRMLSSYVIRRLGEPGDAASMVLFLASDAASWITGQTYPVNGGFSFAV